MKTLVLHLPQFHTFPENDAWWGKGFTEWVNVRKARPLFEGHVQPLVPLGDNYYDLLNPDTLVWQHELARRYGVDGFVYYHYWFNGKLLLERPLELLLRTPEANQEFCLCWANEPWTRAWDGKNKEVIMPQTFGGQPDWDSHIRYLAQFFDDKRYIRHDGQPVLMVYSARNIPQFDEMIRYWNAWLENCGMKGIHLVEFVSTFNPHAYSALSQSVLEFEPLYSAHYEISKLAQAKRLYHKKTGKLDRIDYDYLWSCLLAKRRTYADRGIIRSAFTKFDNTPRKGGRGFVTTGASPEKFERYLTELVCQKRPGYTDVLVINAWNEWGEGAVLEPTEQDGYLWLEAVKHAVSSSLDS